MLERGFIELKPLKYHQPYTHFFPVLTQHGCKYGRDVRTCDIYVYKYNMYIEIEYIYFDVHQKVI